jgi:hypothetical protein
METTPQQPMQPPPRPSWWSRNWKWFVPVGGCGGCLFFILIGVVFFSSILFAVFGALKSSDVYKTALGRAKANPQVVAALGTPIEDGMLVSGNTNTNGASGHADLSIPISGPKGKGTIYAVAEKSAGQWSYSRLEVEIDKTKERIDLNPE